MSVLCQYESNNPNTITLKFKRLHFKLCRMSVSFRKLRENYFEKSEKSCIFAE